MKKLFAITTLLLVFFGINVMAGVDHACYVKAGDKIYFGQKVKSGLFVVRIISSDGTVVKIPNQKVSAYMDGTRLFELKPVVNTNYDTTGMAIMQFVTSRNGLKLYCYDDLNTESVKREFYVFTDDRLYLKLDKTNAAEALAFFGISEK
jgi:hypothetical protein